MANRVRKIFMNDGTWVCPAGVRSVSVTAIGPQFSFLDETHLYFAFLTEAGSRLTWAWGSNSKGQLGNGDALSKSSPVQVLGTAKFVRFSSGGPGLSHNAAIDEQGRLYTWGDNTYGTLGQGNITSYSSPVLVTGPGITYQKVVTRKGRMFALATDGQLYACGLNSSYCGLGVGDLVAKSSLTLVVGGLKFTDIALGPTQFYGLTPNGDLYAWGRNQNGQLGVGDTVIRSSPTLVVGGLSFKKVFTAPVQTGYEDGGSVYGLTTDGQLYAWGINQHGQLGVGDIEPRSTPTLVLGGLRFVKVKADGINSIQGSAVGLTEDGKLYAWGTNNGAFGVGDNVHRSSPVLISGSHTVVDFDMNVGQNTGYITSEGDFYIMGNNSKGQCGTGDTATASSPTLVSGGLKWAKVRVINYSTGYSTFGITNGGLLYGWGDNSSGQLGLGDINARSSPTLVAGRRLADYSPVPVSVTVPVLPGGSYGVKIGGWYSMFGSTLLGQGHSDMVLVEYDT